MRGRVPLLTSEIVKNHPSQKHTDKRLTSFRSDVKTLDGKLRPLGSLDAFEGSITTWPLRLQQQAALFRKHANNNSGRCCTTPLCGFDGELFDVSDVLPFRCSTSKMLSLQIKHASTKQNQPSGEVLEYIQESSLPPQSVPPGNNDFRKCEIN